MFENVAELEKEIETFRKNIVASSELVEGISDLTAITKQQKADFASQSAELLKKLDACVQQFKADHEAALAALSSSNAETVSALEAQMQAEQKARLDELLGIQQGIEKTAADTAARSKQQMEQFSSECERLICKMQAVLQEQQSTYLEHLSEVEKTVQGYQVDTEKRYSDFLSRLENTNVDQIFKEVQDLKQSVQTKFLILMGGVGVTLIVAILGLVMR